MKKRIVSKKLALNKWTVVNFDDSDQINLNNIKGGETFTCVTCNTCLRVPGGSFCIACYGDSEAPDCTQSGAPTC